MSLNRIRTDHRCDALVAVDSFPLLAARMERLLPPGRRLSVAHRYATYTGHAPEVHGGLTVALLRVNLDTTSLWVECEPESTMGFGFSVRDVWLAATEDNAWKYYHAGQHEADAFFDRRRDLTHVHLVGGRDGDDLSREDRIVIRTYNRDGVCDERVIGFDA